MHENLKTITCSFSYSKSIICTTPDTFYQYQEPAFGADAVFHDIGKEGSRNLFDADGPAMQCDVRKHRTGRTVRTGAKYRSWVLVNCVWCGEYY